MASFIPGKWEFSLSDLESCSTGSRSFVTLLCIGRSFDGNMSRRGEYLLSSAKQAANRYRAKSEGMCERASCWQMPGEPTCVHLQISDLRDKWTQAQLEQVVRELRRLASPLEAQENGFRIYLDLSAFKSEVDGFEGRSLVAGALAALEDADSEEDDWRQVKPFRLDNVYHYQVRGGVAADGSFTGAF